MRLLDLFCGEGLAALGYWNSGRFSEIVGVDIDDKLQRSYSFDFVHADCMKLDYDFLMSFDFIHASPPCQYYSKLTPDRTKHPRLIPGVRLMLAASGVPHIIENVEGSSYDLRPNVVMNGGFVGLPLERRRYFYISSVVDTHQLIKRPPGSHISIHGDEYTSLSVLHEAFGLSDINNRQASYLTMSGIEQGFPPRMAEYLARSLIAAPFLIS